MIVDTSAIMAIALNEQDRTVFVTALVSADAAVMSAANWVELEAVLINKKEVVRTEVENILSLFGISVLPVTVEQARIAREAYRRYGRGTGHPARLNFGDCFAYALAKARDEPLLFKGDDFVQTDVRAAL